MLAEVGQLIARVRARFTVDSKGYKGTVTRVVAADEPGAADPYDCTCVADYTNSGGVLRPGIAIPLCRKCLERKFGEMEVIAGIGRNDTIPGRTPVSTILSPLEPLPSLPESRYRYLVCSECKLHGKARTFRTAEGFADHLKNYHGAKDGDAVERLT